MNRLKISATVAVVAIAVVGIIWARRVQIETWAWHYRHGMSVAVGSYVIPVPANWFVENLDNGDKMLVRLDTDDKSSTRRLKAHAGILLLLGKPLTARDVDFLKSVEITALRKQGIEVASQRTFSVDGETISCLNTKSDSTGAYDVEPAHWNCRSPGGLQVIVGSTEPDMKQVWEILSGVRKKS